MGKLKLHLFIYFFKNLAFYFKMTLSKALSFVLEMRKEYLFYYKCTFQFCVQINNNNHC